MKRRITCLSALLALSSLTACDKNKEVAPKPEPVDKTVTFQVFSDLDFSYSQYSEEDVTIQLIIRRKKKNEPNGLVTQVFDSTFTMALKDIPMRTNKLVIKKVVPAVLDGKENVFMSSGYHYKQSSFGQNKTFPANELETTMQLIVY